MQNYICKFLSTAFDFRSIKKLSITADQLLSYGNIKTFFFVK